jgi:hypothetical protein
MILAGRVVYPGFTRHSDKDGSRNGIALKEFHIIKKKYFILLHNKYTCIKLSMNLVELFL